MIKHTIMSNLYELIPQECISLSLYSFSVGNNGKVVNSSDTLLVEVHIVSTDSICDHGGINKIRM